ncbi:MAG: PDDEXK nuclease domain-containing protein [Nitrospiraceae bacterium]|nr:PDDEXK nuclease domain-containing protein [Nitrospiraceae bacterium]
MKKKKRLQDAAESLSKYAYEVKPGESMKQMKDRAWEKAVYEKSVKKCDALRHEFYEAVADVLRSARSKTYHAVNFAMVGAYWNVGRMIVEEEQRGHKRAGYGKALIQELSMRLVAEFGSGFGMTNLAYFRRFYLTFPIFHTLCEKSEDSSDGAAESEIGAEPWHLLTWSHFKLLLRVEKPEARHYYAREAAEQNWSVRALDRQINSLYYERLKMSRKKKPVIEDMQERTMPFAAEAKDLIKDPYVLEFLGLKDNPDFRESDLEQAIIGKLQAFMLELGKGFAFVARQQRLSTETKDFFIDLVFYNYLLKCFVLIDLKTGELAHQDIGQMDMYVRLYEDKYKSKDDNPTIGIILCTDKDETVVKYSVLKENKQLFASKYKLYLPSEKELIEEIEREKEMFVREQEAVYGVGT